MKNVVILILFLALCVSWNNIYSEEVKEKQITLKDAIYQALKNNLDLQVQKASSESSWHGLRINKSIFIPTLNIGYGDDSQLRPSTDVYDGVNVVENKSKDWQFNVSQLTPYGGRLNLTFYTRNVDTNSLKSFVDPAIDTYAGARFTQPLLKGFGSTATKYNIKISANTYKMNQYQLKDTVNMMVYSVEAAYWELVYAYQSLEATKMALQRAQDLLKQNELKVKVGTLPPIEILSSKAEVARYESSLIQSERSIQAREEALKRIINMSKDNVTLIPIDMPKEENLEANFDTFLKEAMDNRNDIKRVKLNLKNAGIGLRYTKNQALPTLQFDASFFSYGQGGTIWKINRDLPPTDPNIRTKNTEKTFADSIDEVFSFVNKNYSISFSLQIPVGFAREKAMIAQARLVSKQAFLELEQVESTIFSEVKDAVKELEATKKLVEADKIALELEGENLKAVEKKLSVGIATNFEVLSYQQRYASAQNQALRSKIDYNLTMAKINRILNRTFSAYGIDFKGIAINE